MSNSGLIGAWQVRKSYGRGPKEKIEVFEPGIYARDRDELADHCGNLCGRPDGVFRYVNPERAETEIVGCGQSTQYASPLPLKRSLPLSSAAATTMTGPPNLCARSVLGLSGAKNPQVDDERVDLSGPDFRESFRGHRPRSRRPSPVPRGEPSRQHRRLPQGSASSLKVPAGSSPCWTATRPITFEGMFFICRLLFSAGNRLVRSTIPDHVCAESAFRSINA